MRISIAHGGRYEKRINGVLPLQKLSLKCGESKYNEAAQYIFENAGKHFDPLLVTHFKKIHHAFDKIWQTLKDEREEHSPYPVVRAVV